MSNYANIKSYFLILNKIRNDKPNKKELLDYINNHVQMVGRTLERHIERLRDDFGQNIIWKSSTNQYILQHDNSIDTNDLLKYLELGSAAHVFLKNLKEIKERTKFISFDGSADLKGIMYLDIILDSIVNCRWIEFDHEKFEDNSVSKRVMQPYLLKEYLKRWFVVGLTENNELRNFGIERMSNVVLLNKKFVRNAEWNPKEAYKHVVGIYANSTVEEVILKFRPQQAKYIKTLPLHSSQTVVKENDKETIVKLEVQVNYELIQQILFLGKTVQVVRPQSLVRQVSNILKETLAQYD